MGIVSHRILILYMYEFDSLSYIEMMYDLDAHNVYSSFSYYREIEIKYICVCAKKNLFRFRYIIHPPLLWIAIHVHCTYYVMYHQINYISLHISRYDYLWQLKFLQKFIALFIYYHSSKRGWCGNNVFSIFSLFKCGVSGFRIFAIVF